jgi:hypothetical protein
MDETIANGIAEETVPTQSIQELETRLETALKSIEDTDIKIGKHIMSGDEAVRLRQLRYAYNNLVLALECNIAGKMKRAVRCESAQIEKGLHEAMMELVVAENRLRIFEDGSITLLWDRVKVARERWWNAIDASCKHRSTCPTCLANRSR